MANNYCQGSQTWEFTDPKHKQWFEHNLDTVKIFWDETPCDHNESAGGVGIVGWREANTVEEEVNDCIEVPRFRLVDLEHYSKDNNYELEWLGFEYEIGDTEIWFYGEEYVDMVQVAELMHLFFEENELHKEYFYMTTADTCSKMRVEEFGGGACFVTSGSIEYMGTYSWVQEKIEEFENNIKTKENQNAKD